MKSSSTQQPSPVLTSSNRGVATSNKSKQRIRRIVLWSGCLVLLAPVALMIISASHFRGVSGHPPESRIDSDKRVLMTILTQYFLLHREFPKGDTIAVFKALRGDGTKSNLLSGKQDHEFDLNGVSMDPWRTGYRLYFNGDEILIRSAGPNRTFDDLDASKSDDIIF